MGKKVKVRKKPIRSPRSPNTKKLSEYALTSKPTIHHQLAFVEGRSMWPSLKPGDTVAYLPVDFVKIIPGEIIVFQKPSQNGLRDLRVHRVLYRRGNWLLESGDNTEQAAFVSPKQILGRVDWVKRGKKWQKPPKHRLQQKQWVLLAAAAAYLELNRIKNIWIGPLKSERLWNLSKRYREALHSLGLDLPLLWPK